MKLQTTAKMRKNQMERRAEHLDAESTPRNLRFLGDPETKNAKYNIVFVNVFTSLAVGYYSTLVKNVF